MFILGILCSIALYLSSNLLIIQFWNAQDKVFSRPDWSETFIFASCAFLGFSFLTEDSVYHAVFLILFVVLFSTAIGFFNLVDSDKIILYRFFYQTNILISDIKSVTLSSKRGRWNTLAVFTFHCSKFDLTFSETNLNEDEIEKLNDWIETHKIPLELKNVNAKKMNEKTKIWVLKRLKQS